MNILLIILLLIVGLFVLLLIIGLFTKKEYAVERDIIINKPRQQIFEYIKYLKNHDNFSKWAKMDPEMKKEYKGTDGNVGFISAWDSDVKNVGKGEQEIVRITEGSRLNMALRFIKPFAATADAYMITEDVGTNQTKVRWGLESKMKYPMNLMLLFMNMDKMLGEDLKIGLINLKVLMEVQQ